MDDSGFSGTQAAKIVGITYRQLDYWARTDLIRPSLAEATGSGSRRRYSYRDLLELRVIKTLLDAGIRLESVREVFTYLRQHVTSDIAAAHIVISGTQVMLCDGDQLVDVLRGARACSTCCRCRASRTTSTPSSSRSPTRPRRSAPRRAIYGMTATAARSPLDAVHRALGARMVPFGGWEMPLEYAGGTIAEHLACRQDAVVFDVSHLGTVQVTGDGAMAVLQEALSNDLGKIAPGPSPVHAPPRRAPTAPCSTTSSCGGTRRRCRRRRPFDVMPNASNTDRVRDAIGGRETTHERAVLAVQGPQALDRLATVFPAAAAVGRFRVGHADVARRAVHRGRHRLHGRAWRRDRRPRRRRGRRCGPRSSTPASSRPGSAPATRCASRPGSRCTATSWDPGSRRCRPGWAGSWRGPSRRSGDAPRWRPSATPASPATSSASPPRAGGRRVRTAPCSSTATPSATVTSGNFSPVLGHGIALAFVPPSIGPGTPVAIDVRGTALRGTVVDTPFVAKR